MIISGSSAEVGSSKSIALGCMARDLAMAALLLAAGELGRHLLGLLGHANAAQELHALLTGLVARHAKHLSRAAITLSMIGGAQRS